MSTVDTHQNDDIPDNFDELILCREQLKEEEDFLVTTLMGIEKQIHALQVEQMHLLHCITQSDSNKNNPLISKAEAVSQKVPTDKTNTNKGKLINDECNSTINLDLNFTPAYQFEEEEESDDEDDDDDDDEYII